MGVVYEPLRRREFSEFYAMFQQRLGSAELEECRDRLRAAQALEAELMERHPERVASPRPPLPMPRDGEWMRALGNPRYADGEVLTCDQLCDYILESAGECGYRPNRRGREAFRAFLRAAVLLMWDWLNPGDLNFQTLSGVFRMERLSEDRGYKSPLAMIFEQIETGVYPVLDKETGRITYCESDLVNNRTHKIPREYSHRTSDGKVVRGASPKDDRSLAAYKRYRSQIGDDWPPLYDSIARFAEFLADDVGAAIEPYADARLTTYRQCREVERKVRRLKFLTRIELVSGCAQAAWAREGRNS